MNMCVYICIYIYIDVYFQCHTSSANHWGFLMLSWNSHQLPCSWTGAAPRLDHGKIDPPVMGTHTMMSLRFSQKNLSMLVGFKLSNHIGSWIKSRSKSISNPNQTISNHTLSILNCHTHWIKRAIVKSESNHGHFPTCPGGFPTQCGRSLGPLDFSQHH